MIGATRPTAGTRTGLLFPGQGVQAAGMGEPWRDCAGWEVVDEVCEATGIDVADLLLNTPGETLRRTDLAQVAVFTTAMIAFREWADELGPPHACAGHSVGEYAALVAAGALSLADGARLVAARGRAMLAASERSPGTMAAVLADAQSVTVLAADVTDAGSPVWTANFNAPRQVVVTGTVAAVQKASEMAAERGMKAIRLQVGGAFHSPLMASAAEELGCALQEAQFAPRHVPVVANVDARSYTGGCDWPDLLMRQLTGPVLWVDVVRCLAEDLRCARLVELGTGKTIAGTVRRIAVEVETFTVNSPSASPARTLC
jgi:[acyl-carrier-protein] S-malonyltransferase